MYRLYPYLKSYIQKYQESGFLLVCYAILAELLLLGFFLFAGFFTIETVLPEFVSERFSLANFFAFLALLSLVLAFLGHILHLSFPWKVSQKNLLLWIGTLWAISILAVSLYQFPLWSIPLLISGFISSGFLAWSIFVEKENR